VTPTLRIQYNNELLISHRGIQVTKTSRDLGDPLQIWQGHFVCSYKIILLSVRVCFHDTSMSVPQLRKRSLFPISVWTKSLDDAYLIHRHSKSHDGGKIQEKFCRKGLMHCPHPPDSPDLSPCDFWFFGMAKEKMKDREFAQFKIFTAVWQRSGMISLSKTSNLYSVSGRSA
jgi:hypothetical protein